MAHSRTTDVEANVMRQCTFGRRTRYVKSAPVIIAQARTNMTDPNHVMADAIKAETANKKAVFVAPCDCKIIKCYVNASTYATCAAGGTATIKFVKAVSGTDVDLCSTIAVSGEAGSVPIAETAIDGVMSITAGALDVQEGELVYMVIAVSAHNITTRTNALIGCVEFTPIDA